MVGQYESLEFHISRLKGQDEKPYTIGLPLGRISIKTECLLMEKFYLFAPGHNIQFLFYQSSEVEACLRSREFDALLVTRVFWQEDRNKTPAFCTIPGTRCTLLHNQPLCIVMRADHPLAGQADVDVGDLREQSFILYYDPIREGIRTGDIQTDGFLRHCQQAGFVPKLEIISKNISELRNVCVENFNWVYPTFQPNWMLPSSQIRAVPLKDPLYGSEYYLITAEDHTDDTTEIVRRFFRQTFSAD